MSALRVPVVTPPRELTDASLPAFEAQVEPLLAGAGPGMVLDLAGVSFINSTGLGFLVKVGMKLDAANRRLALARPDRNIERTLRLIGLDQKLPLFKTLGDATGFVQRESPAQA
jgi:anti-sigma B factor antagonist